MQGTLTAASPQECREDRAEGAAYLRHAAPGLRECRHDSHFAGQADLSRYNLPATGATVRALPVGNKKQETSG
jgi:hypothetical protein